VISGGVSASREIGLELFRFALMAMPHTDDASCDAARRPGEHDKPRIEPACCDEARLVVVLAIICTREVRPGKDFLCSAHVQTAFLQRPFAFCRVAGDPHGLTVATINGAVNKVATMLNLLANA